MVGVWHEGRLVMDMLPHTHPTHMHAPKGHSLLQDWIVTNINPESYCVGTISLNMPLPHHVNLSWIYIVICDNDQGWSTSLANLQFSLFHSCAPSCSKVSIKMSCNLFLDILLHFKNINLTNVYITSPTTWVLM